MKEFLSALFGGRGDLDAWLECNNEQECRDVIIPIVQQRDELLAALKEVMAAHRAYPKRFTDDVQKLEGIMERQRKACIAADEAIAKAESN